MMEKDLEILIPFKGKNRSANFNDNFLTRYKNIYFMDNHRLALWCWCQKINTSQNYNFLHVDMHHDFYDERPIKDEKYGNILGLKKLSLNEYQSLEFPSKNGIHHKVFDWQNYLYYFFQMNHRNTGDIKFLTYEKPEMVKELMSKIDPDRKCSFLDANNDLFCDIDLILKNKPDWIVNIDLDFFFCENLARDGILRYSEEFIDEFFRVIFRYIDTNIAVLTIAFSPEYCGGSNDRTSIEGWNNSLFIVRKLFYKLELPFDEIFERNWDAKEQKITLGYSD